MSDFARRRKAEEEGRALDDEDDSTVLTLEYMVKPWHGKADNQCHQFFINFITYFVVFAAPSIIAHLVSMSRLALTRVMMKNCPRSAMSVELLGYLTIFSDAFPGWPLSLFFSVQHGFDV